MGCNSGVLEEEKSKSKFLQSLVNLGDDFISVFTFFGDIVGSVLGLNVESKKSDVGKYFKTVQDTVQGTKDKLVKIVADMKREGNPNAAGVESAVNKLVSETLDKIIDGAKIVSEAIGTEGTELIGNVATTNAGVVGNVDKLINGIKVMVEVVLKEGKHDAGTDKKADGLTARTANAAAGNGEAGKLFSANADTAENAKKSAADAAKAVGAVTGADILQAMVKADKAAKLAKSNDGNAGAAPKDAEVAGGIALRAMAKGGKFAGPTAENADYATVVKGAAVSAVAKTLDTLTVVIRHTIDSGFKAVKEAMKINANDTPVSADNRTSELKK
ncbi:variable large family protein [Borrelia persica]|uniref:variable large family protein n=1 Tax=Borrelia persica TaxID=44448 RepID=UPI0006840943|nr:variable large family protein [Borrelia persica]